MYSAIIFSKCRRPKMKATPARVVRAASRMNAAAPHLYKKEDVEPGQPGLIHAEESVARIWSA